MIIVGYDGSTDAQRAISVAAELVEGRTVLVHVWDPPPAGAASAAATPGLAGAGLSMLAEAVVRGQGGTAWRDLFDVAESRNARVVVVGRRGVSRLRSALLGSVSRGLVEHARVPVLVVPAGPETS